MTRSEKPLKRLFVDASLEDARLLLETEQAHYLGRVLRCREGDRIVVFNGRGRERSAAIENLGRRRPTLALGAEQPALPEPPVPILLLQALVKSDAMDLIVQKATELGVAAILAARTEFSVVRLDTERETKRIDHWQRIAISACEQSGRHRPPDFTLYGTLARAIEALPDDCARVAFHTQVAATTGNLPVGADGICLAIGPEGGFSRTDARELEVSGFVWRSLGPRTLRAETAAIAAVTSAQLGHGDLG